MENEIMTKEHWEQVYEYVRWAGEGDICYGDQEEFEKRHKEIEIYIEEFISQLGEE